MLLPGGRIDHAHHANNAFRANSDGVAFDAAVTKAQSMVDVSDTLMIVTADHSHVFTISGYPDINQDIYGSITNLKTLCCKIVILFHPVNKV